MIGAGAAGAALMAHGGRARAKESDFCIARPSQTEGPFFVDERLHRSDIRSDPVDRTIKNGVQLNLTLRVHRWENRTCTPLPGAIVDIWHCDALGIYSDVIDVYRRTSTEGKKFLRGYQVTDKTGAVEFTTIYPGWYGGRTVHIHFKIRGMARTGRKLELTSQLYFEESISDAVLALPPYAKRGDRDTRNRDDDIYRDGGGQLIVDLQKTDRGYRGIFDIGLID